MGKTGAVVLSVIISVLLTSGISYFMIPYLAPAPPESEETDEIPTGLILQSNTLETIDYVQLNDTNTTWTVMPTMETTITTDGNSTLEVMFHALMFMYIQPDLVAGGSVLFSMALEIEGVTNQSVLILHQRGENNADYIFAEFYPCSIFLRVETPTLAAGTYSINVLWKSMGDAAGNNRLTTGAFLIENPYTLNVKEISA
jgi:hypothetical protein